MSTSPPAPSPTRRGGVRTPLALVGEGESIVSHLVGEEESSVSHWEERRGVTVPLTGRGGDTETLAE